MYKESKSFIINKQDKDIMLNDLQKDENFPKNEEEKKDGNTHKKLSALVADDENYCLQMVETFLKSNSLKGKIYILIIL